MNIDYEKLIPAEIPDDIAYHLVDFFYNLATTFDGMHLVHTMRHEKAIHGSRYLVIDFSHPWLKSTRQRAKLRAATVLRPLTFALNEQSVCLPQ